MKQRPVSDWVAIVLAFGIAFALNIITIAAMAIVLWQSLHGGEGAVPQGLGENTTQVLTGWGGGMLGVLGAYVGYQFGKIKGGKDDGPLEPPAPPTIGGQQ
jgi:hypothetical protein